MRPATAECESHARAWVAVRDVAAPVLTPPPCLCRARPQTLWEQYELEERYEQLEGKVTYINDVIKYCLEVQKENKFLRLERMIVYLITIELFVSLLHTPGVLDTLAEWWATIRTALAA